MSAGLHHSDNIRDKIQTIEDTIHTVIRECRSEKDLNSADPLGESLLETTAKVLEGLGEVFHAYHISNVPPVEDERISTKDF